MFHRVRPRSTAFDCVRPRSTVSDWARSRVRPGSLFNWPVDHGRVVIVGIANTMDLPERILPRVASRLNNRVGFRSYTYEQARPPLPPPPLPQLDPIRLDLI